MAGPISHIICALTILQSGLLDISDHKAFVLGTSFPNIRYYQTRVKRDHRVGTTVTWEQVKKEKNPFIAGLLFHYLVDRIREEYIQANRIYDDIPTLPLCSDLMRMVDDMVAYPLTNQWPTIIHYFDEIHGLELCYNVSEEDLRGWHTILQEYFKKEPDITSMIELFKAVKLNKGIALIAQPFIPTVALYPRLIHFLLQRTTRFINFMKYFYANADLYLSGQVPMRVPGGILQRPTALSTPVMH